MNKRKIEDKFLAFTGLLEQIYGKITDLIVYDARRERRKKVLSHVYGYVDVEDCFPPKLDRRSVENQIKMLASYYADPDNPAPANTPK